MEKARYIIITILITVAFLMAYHSKVAVAAGDENVLSVTNISTPDRPGYAIYWQKDKGHAKVERKEESAANFEAVTETDLNYFIDYSVKQDGKYQYKVSFGSNVILGTVSDELSGKPEISVIKLDPGATTKTQSSIIVNFKTDKLAKTQIFYGESVAYTNQTELNDSLNQSHTILLEKLKPNTTYHVKIKAYDKTGSLMSESEDQTLVTPVPPQDITIFQIIVDALSKAFSGFESWFKK